MKKTLMATGVALAFMCQGALASTYNFIQLIDGNNPGGTFEGVLGDGTVVAPGTPAAGGIGEDGYQSASWTVDGRKVMLTATATDGGGNIVDAAVYFDGGNAGVGVCPSTPVNNQCSPSSDDNTRFGETLKASFAGAVDVAVDQLQFRNANHSAFYDNTTLGNVLVRVTGGANDGLVATIASLTGQVLNGSMFEFFTDASNNSQQFYLSSLTATPLPAAFLLFGAGLLGLFGAGRARANQSS